MEFKILLYIIGFIIYFIYSARKATKKRDELRGSKPASPQQKSWEEELKEILSRNAAQSTTQNPYYQEEEEEEVDSRMPEVQEYEQNQQEDWKAHLAQEKYSVEVDETSLAQHIRELQENMESKGEQNSVGHDMFHKEEFDARKAFIYSEVFRAKYQED